MPISITKQPHQDSTAEFTCKIPGWSETTYIHWYRALAGGAPQRLLYLSYSERVPSLDPGFSSMKLSAHFQSRSICKLFVHMLEKGDSGHYYCAVWNYTQCHKPPAALHTGKPKTKPKPHTWGSWAQISYYCSSRDV
uniref:Ig-like domain-containing protein n=1 Tax=Pelusios castaneus TaxID=367368 RepID=A0A8C8STF1_9SAUR